MATNGLNWFIRRQDTVADACAFYRDGLGLRLLRGGDHLQMLWAGETSVFEVNDDGADVRTASPDRDGCSPIFRVADPDAVAARLGARPFEEDSTDGRTVFVRDPGGFRLGLRAARPDSPNPLDVEARRRLAAGETAIPGVDPLPPDVQHLGWVRRAAVDPAGLAAFYTAALGMPALGPASVDLGDCCALELVPGGSPESRPATRFALTSVWIVRVRDFDSAYARAIAAGARDAADIVRFSSGSVLAYLQDPEGHAFGIQQRSRTLALPEDEEAERRMARAG